MPKKKSGGQLHVKQVRSGINRPRWHQATLRALGLRHHQDDVILPDNPSIRGMLNHVSHLIEVTPVEDTP